ncbi:sigma-70 family RNA polymerase sigma factor [Pelorhabdus rhamnosifermentans]|uniref:sigma-70 family RNA polymerase sigma factor n=1 Tax=Pelorhabdus rhamnosifermentans TaxID=2772457 RepID=UPI001C05EE1B|nr:sigma-70 family RNA polymerase sigma factor [Pelorhabdus rhamnosifermentans]
MNLHEYLQELNKIELLSPDLEQSLWQSYKEQGDVRSRGQLIEHYQPLVFKVVARFKASENLVMDLIQEGTVGLIEAAENYEPKRGIAFSLYAVHRIRGRMLNFIQKEGKQNCAYMESPLEADTASGTLGDCLADLSPSVAQQAEQHFLVDELKTALRRLPQKEQLVVSGMYLEEQEPKALANTLNVSTSHLYRLQKQGVRRIRGMMSKLMQNW